MRFGYDALEPYIDAETMELHHGKHHQAYVDQLNKALEPYPQLADLTIDDLLGRLDQVPETIRTAVQNNGGGHVYLKYRNRRQQYLAAWWHVVAWDEVEEGLRDVGLERLASRRASDSHRQRPSHALACLRWRLRRDLKDRDRALIIFEGRYRRSRW